LLNRKKQPIASLLCQAPIVPMQFRHFNFIVSDTLFL
jgi:hypothetical protein